jgi:hypothetical protein
MLALLKEREPRYTALRQRLGARGSPAGSGILTPAAMSSSSPSSSSVSSHSERGAPQVGEMPAAERPRPDGGTAATRYGSAPRPRKRRRR